MAKAATTSDAPGASAESAAQSRTGAASTAPSAGPDAVGTSPVEVGKPVVVSDSTSAPEIPGSEFLGRGVYLSPRQPYELKDFLLTRTRKSRLLNIHAGTERAYAIPEDSEVNHSPPLPAGTCIGQTIIEESWSRFSRELTLNASAAVGDQGLSIDATSFHGSNLQSAEDSYYAMRKSFIPFYSVYLPRVDQSVVVEDVANELTRKKINVPFDPNSRSDYAKIFDRFGTHYVKSAWIGGKASLIFVVDKSLSKEEIKSGIEVTFAGTKTGAATSEIQERVRAHSSCTVFGSGGDATALAKLTTLSAKDYDAWVDSVKNNPEVIEFGVAGIWTLLTDHREAQALKEAYLWESKFSPLNCIIPYKRWLVFTKGYEAFDYARQQDPKEIMLHQGTHSRLYGLYRSIYQDKAEPRPRLKLVNYLPALDSDRYSDFQQPHAAFTLAVGRDQDWKLYLFNWRECLRIDVNTRAVDDGYPRGMSEEWPDVDLDRIDAAVSVGPDKIYFFRGAQYIRLDRRDGGWRLGIKDSIKKHWPGVVFDKIDTAAYWGSNKIYFFSEDQYIRYDFGSHRADPGYPRSLSSNYLEDWELFD
jgi:hypothetical protein